MKEGTLLKFRVKPNPLLSISPSCNACPKSVGLSIKWRQPNSYVKLWANKWIVDCNLKYECYFLGTWTEQNAVKTSTATCTLA